MGFTFCSLASGSSGNCQYIASEDTHILVDAGLSGKKIKECMDSIGKEIEKIQAILVTHEHSDHTKGIGILSRRYNIPIYANEKTWNEIMGKIGKVDEENIKVFNTGEEFLINDVKVKPYEVSHDAADPVAYSFFRNDTKITIATDLGHVCDNIKNEIRDSDLLLLESNHDVEMLKMGSYPWFLKKRVMGDQGHISNEVAGETIAEILESNGYIGHVLLGHLSRENNFPELAYQTVKNILEDKKIKIGKDITIDLTYRDRISKVYEVKKKL
ncbi:MAG: MBL fold metallo-hydrolase [Anaeromicrobium sp.]|jgi:phosphoribosyl 1,2-cyclic phosphodiesterase|uniref:MBL fold metallo-hydrolase n=1 Tax=Anaeromicrobium sp. TaxID=1929132 RepID=UPI0025D288C0|nr:MBL fold metallo-hydrolase [Anaeromicrobium sp.]MCT4594306.1 MBL fold metallo-hydrolase [Anaeromicrobium sp.]